MLWKRQKRTQKMTIVEIPTEKEFVSVYKYDDDGKLVSHSTVKKHNPLHCNQK